MRRPEGSPAHKAGIAVQAARHIDGKDRNTLLRDMADDLGGRSLHVAGKPGAEDRVDDERCAFRSIRGEGIDGACPAMGRLGGIALEAFARTHEEDRDLPAPVA